VCRQENPILPIGDDLSSVATNERKVAPFLAILVKDNGGEWLSQS
jgi:hypothetical protein